MVELENFISICVCTYKRPQLLSELLESIAIQKTGNFRFEVIIVDNDKTGSANAVVQSFIKNRPEVKIRYEIEPSQGISFARNKTVSIASGGLLAFIDDDEVASPTWLFDLMECMEATQADAVFGPVLPVFPENSKKWVIDSGLFDRPRYNDKSIIFYGDARTGNALIRSEWCKKRSPACFDPELAFSGGEDNDFFKWVGLSGGRFFWADKATVAEIVPLERQCLSFVLERRFRSAVTYWRSANLHRPLIFVLSNALVGLSLGLFLLVLGVLVIPFGFSLTARFLAKATNLLGRLGAVANIKHVGYGELK